MELWFLTMHNSDRMNKFVIERRLYTLQYDFVDRK